jgi:predicted transcriptional regulator of viral defense system
VISLTGKEPPSGIFSASQMKSMGLSYMDLSRLVKAGKLERMARGVYETPDAWDDIFYIEQLRRPKIIYSHETALYFHDLTDQESYRLAVTVPAGYNTKALLKDRFRVFSVKPEFYNIDVVQVPTMYGNLVNAYSRGRAVCDVVRSQSRMDPETVANALKRCVRLRKRDIPLLVRTARKVRTYTLLSTFLKVLL